MDKNSKIYKIRHSAAHVLAQAISRLFDDVQLAIGPVTEHGFFYDLKCKQKISESDFEKIEAEMTKIVNQDLAIIGEAVTKDKARSLYEKNPFKLEIIDRIPEETVSIYHQGDFFDLCQGGHTESTKDVKFFKIMAVAGSYWKGDSNNPQLQRISGIAFETKKELRKHLETIELAKKFDHRKIGKDLDLFSFHPEAPGMPFFHHKGTTLFNTIVAYMKKMLDKYEYQEVKTPLVLKECLWHTSGHYENFKENMFFSSAGKDEKFAIRPMNCPCGILVYNSNLHSYKELPLRIAEFGLVHRYELSGVLHGLCRVRSFTQDDAHIFCTKDQMLSEIEKCLEMIEEVYKKFEFNDIQMFLSTKPEKHIGSPELWQSATQALTDAMKNKGYDFKVKEGEGAFYGPKIEIVIKDALEREWQCGTIQVDFFLPERFNSKYVDSDQGRKTPVMIHRAIYGSIERFLAIVLEHYKGVLPDWLSPVQAKIMTITNKHDEHAKKLFKELKDFGLRVELDCSNEKIGAKIKQAQMQKIPNMIIIGDQEVESGEINVRKLNKEQKKFTNVQTFLASFVS